MKIKKGKAALLAIAATALIASLAYDKKSKKEAAQDLDMNDDIKNETENSFIVE